MANNFLVITQDDINLKVAENIRNRENELASYAFEQSHHAAQIAALGNIAWDASTTEYKTLERDVFIKRALANGLSSDAIQKKADLRTLDYHQLNLQAVIIEQTRAQRAYDNLLVILPAGPDRDSAMANLTVKLAAAKSVA